MKTKTTLAALMLLLALAVSFTAKAQVTIGAGIPPATGAVLDLQSNSDLGLLLPRLELTSTTSPSPLEGGGHVKGMFVYNTKKVGDVDEGIYYNDGEKWVYCGERKWFYMPSFNLNVTAVATGLTVDLYAEYRNHFTRAGNSQFVSSNASAATVTPLIYEADKLDYFVTAYPASVLKVNSISTAGVMNYDVLSTNVPEGSFINVIFVVK